MQINIIQKTVEEFSRMYECVQRLLFVESRDENNARNLNQVGTTDESKKEEECVCDAGVCFCKTRLKFTTTFAQMDRPRVGRARIKKLRAE
jgi:hypothetical protein